MRAAADPVVVHLAVPVAVWSGVETEASLSPAVDKEVEVLRDTDDVDGFVAAAKLWSGVGPLGQLRCTWAAAQRAARGGDSRAGNLISVALALAESSGVRAALDGRLTATSKAAGVRWPGVKRKAAPGLTGRETDELGADSTTAAVVSWKRQHYSAT